MSEEARLQIVPPPKPHKEALLRKAATEVPHILFHRPFNPYCRICNEAKLREAPHRKGVSEPEHQATKFGDLATGDFVDGGKDDDLRGVGGFRYALNLRDIGKKVKMCYPQKSRQSSECAESLKLFGGAAQGKSRIARFYCDTEKGLIGAAK